MGEKHEHDVQEVETRYQAQIMALVDAYQQLSRERCVCRDCNVVTVQLMSICSQGCSNRAIGGTTTPAGWCARAICGRTHSQL